MKGHPKWSLKTGSLTGNTKKNIQKVLQNLKWTPKGPKVDPKGAKMETSLAWGSLRYEPSGG